MINTTKTSKNFIKPNVRYRGISIDIAKNFLSVCTIDDDGVVNYHAKMSRDELIKQLAPLRPVRIVMEPCAGSAELAERVKMIGHTPILVSGSAVKAAVLAQCNVLVTNRTRIINSTKGRVLEAGIALNRTDINGRELAQKLPEDALIQQMVAMDRDVIGYLTSKIEELDELIKRRQTQLLDSFHQHEYPDGSTPASNLTGRPFSIGGRNLLTTPAPTSS